MRPDALALTRTLEADRSAGRLEAPAAGCPHWQPAVHSGLSAVRWVFHAPGFHVTQSDAVEIVGSLSPHVSLREHGAGVLELLEAQRCRPRLVDSHAVIVQVDDDLSRIMTVHELVDDRLQTWERATAAAAHDRWNAQAPAASAQIEEHGGYGAIGFMRVLLLRAGSIVGRRSACSYVLDDFVFACVDSNGTCLRV